MNLFVVAFLIGTAINLFCAFVIHNLRNEVNLLSDSNIAKDKALKESKESAERLTGVLQNQLKKFSILITSIDELDSILSQAKSRLPLKYWNRHFSDIENLNEKFMNRIQNPDQPVEPMKKPAPKISFEDWIKQNFRVPETAESFELISMPELIDRLKKEFANLKNVNENQLRSFIISGMLNAGFKRDKNNFWNIKKIEKPVVEQTAEAN